MDISPHEGNYQITWRVQFFSTRLTDSDQLVITERRDKANFTTSQSNPLETSDAETTFNDCSNPFNWPVWSHASAPDLPNRPQLCFSVGYGIHYPEKVKNYDVNFLKDPLLSAQILQPGPKETVNNPAQGSVRVDRWVKQKEWWENVDRGWFHLKAEKPFKVMKGAKPVLVICALDSTNWLGGVRFGGVEFETCSNP